MNRCFFFRPRLSLLAGSAAVMVATLAAAPVLRAQSPTPEPTEAKHDGTADIFEAIKKGADKLQKQSKEASKIEPQIKQLEERQAEYIKHQEEVERHLAELLVKQEAELQRLSAAVEGLATEMKTHHPIMLPAPPAPPAFPAPPAGPVAPLPATEPSATP